MGDIKASLFLALYGLFLLGCYVDTTSSPPTCGPGQCSKSQDPPLVQRVMFQKCNSSLDYCIHGECIQLEDIPEPHCKCPSGYFGPRCEHLDLDKSIQPTISEEHIILTVMCVGLLLIGIAGLLYFSIKWTQKNRRPPPEKNISGSADGLSNSCVCVFPYV
ncbi:proepiregulin-like [Brienomyrus brachyistius]|uniref:proepiregulin-like n=1 Tax=Brienomyrus brachyistius TaxID=42636 RepID=UPI0020B2F223|nr:proepiregulin-like [Brienomyrus brachyistius]